MNGNAGQAGDLPGEYPGRDGNVGRSELALVIREYDRRLAELDRRVAEIDAGGTRNFRVLEERVSEMHRELQELRRETAEGIKWIGDAQRWRLATFVTSLGGVTAVVLLVLHILGIGA